MKAEALRELTIEELDQKEREFKRKLFNALSVSECRTG